MTPEGKEPVTKDKFTFVQVLINKKASNHHQTAPYAYQLYLHAYQK